MKELFIKLIEFRSALDAQNKIDSSTRELAIYSTLSNFIEYLEQNHKQYEIEKLKQSALTVWISSHPQELRENLLEDVFKKLYDINEENLEKSFYPVLSDIVILEPLFKDRVFPADFLEKVRSFRAEYDELKSKQLENLPDLLKLIQSFYETLRQQIEFTGITLGQIELAASEIGGSDYSFNLSNHLSLLDDDFSEYRKTIFLIQSFTVVSAVNGICLEV